MSDEDREKLLQFLAANWYDRREDDAAIVKEYLAEVPPAYVNEVAGIIQTFLASTQPLAEKAKFVRSAAYRYFPDGDDAPLVWLKKIYSLLGQ